MSDTYFPLVGPEKNGVKVMVCGNLVVHEPHEWKLVPDYKDWYCPGATEK